MARHADAEPLFRRAIEGCEAALGPTHPDTLGSVNSLGLLYYNMARYADAEPLDDRVVGLLDELEGYWGVGSDCE